MTGAQTEARDAAAAATAAADTATGWLKGTSSTGRALSSAAMVGGHEEEEEEEEVYEAEYTEHEQRIDPGTLRFRSEHQPFHSFSLAPFHVFSHSY